jgi:hypothetical protein
VGRSERPASIRELVLDSCSVDLATSHVPALAEALRRRPRVVRRRCLLDVDRLMGGKARWSKVDRIAAAMVLAALLPESLAVVKKWLARFDDRSCYELQFSLFCFLGDVQVLPVKPTLRKAVLDAVADYLAVVKSETGQAAWMAGDLLGDHWVGREALSALVDVALNGRHAAGRRGALYGLKQRLERPGERKAVLDALRLVATRDRSAQLKRYASSILARG